MSTDTQGGAGRREVAWRVFAAEYDDASFEYSEDDDERAPNYVVLPTGARVNRLFVVGVLTEIEAVNEDVLRARIVDPTGAFVVYAGQYQPDAVTFLERADPPAFVALTGKARTFSPDDSDRVFTSIRPESINEVDAATRDRWTVQAAAHTIDRVAVFADARSRPERGDDLTAVLRAADVDFGLAAGVPLALEHYETTTGYLAALRDRSVQVLELVAGERDQVPPLELAPDEGGDADVDLDLEPPVTPAAGVDAPETGGQTSPVGGDGPAGAADDPPAAESSPDRAAAESSEGPSADESTGDSGDGDPAADAPAAGESGVEAAASSNEAGSGESVEGTDADEAVGAGEIGDFDDFDVGSGAESAETDDLYEMDEAEREEIEAEYGTEFETGTEVDAPGEADIETPSPDSGEPKEPVGESVDGSVDPAEADTSAAPEDDVEGEPAPEQEAEPEVQSDPEAESGVEPEAESGVEPEAESGVEPEAESGVEPEAESDAEPELEVEPESGDESDSESGPDPDGDVDLEAAAVEEMRDLDDGDGADREAVIEAVTSATGADPDAVEDAIQEALMSGRCYEPADDRLKAI